MGSIHFVGIGGCGLSAPAMLALKQGYEVSGSDIAWSSFMDGLQEAGALLHTGHSVANTQGSGASRLPEAAVVSNYIPHNNVDILYAKSVGVPVRLAAMKDDFANALHGADQVVVTEVCCLDTQFHAAREIDVQNVGGRELAATIIGPPSECVPSLGDVVDMLASQISMKPHGKSLFFVLTLGAGEL